MTDYKFFSDKLNETIKTIKKLKRDRKFISRNLRNYHTREYYRLLIVNAKNNYKFYLNRLHAISLYYDHTLDERIVRMVRSLNKRRY